MDGVPDAKRLQRNIGSISPAATATTTTPTIAAAAAAAVAAATTAARPGTVPSSAGHGRKRLLDWFKGGNTHQGAHPEDSQGHCGTGVLRHAVFL